MNARLARVSTIIAATILLLSCAPAYAWRVRTMTEFQTQRVVSLHEAEDLAGAAKAIAQDKFASEGKAVRLATGGAKPSLTADLDAGTYGVWLYARTPGARMEGPWPPVYVEMTVKSPGGATTSSRQRIAYLPVYHVITRLYFIAHEKGSYQVELSIGKGSADALLLDFVEVRDELDGCVLRAVKRARHLTDDDTLARIRKQGWKGKPPVRHLPEKASVADMAALFAATRASLPPMNALLGRCDRVSSEELKQLQKKLSRGDFKPSDISQPWALIDAKAGVRYEAANYARGEHFEGDLPDDGGGFYVPTGKHGVTGRALTIAPLATFFGKRLRQIVTRAEKLSKHYEATGDPASAREAAILLAALAERFPTFTVRVQSMTRTFGPTYYGRFNLSTGNFIQPMSLVHTYDRIFDAIRDDRDLARAVSSKIPSVANAEDLRAFLDCNVLQYEAMLHFRFARLTMQFGWERRMTDLLLAIGPNEIGRKFMDRFMYRQTHADHTGDGGYCDHMINGFHRDGANYNGGALYMLAPAANVVNNAIALDRFAALGGEVPLHTRDPKVNPRLLRAGYFYLNYRAAGGFTSLFGDGGCAVDHRFYRDPHPQLNRFGEIAPWLFRHSGDPRYAKVATLYGRPAFVSDEDWAKIAEAAEDQPVPTDHSRSISLPAFGHTMLELGEDDDDPRLKGAAALRHGLGRGHNHGDLCDLTLFAYNKRIITDGGRGGWPWMRFTSQHNTVEVDRHTFQSTGINSGPYGYPLLLREVGNARFASAGGWATTHPQLKDYRRDVAMIDLGVHNNGDTPLRHYYVFDVIRVGGGRVHTYSTHAMQSHKISFGTKTEPVTDGKPVSLLHGTANARTGVTTDPQVTVWRARELKRDVELPHGLRHHLFGWGGMRFYSAWGTHRVYNREMPFLWIERTSEGPLHGSYASVFEPFFGDFNLTSVKPLKVEGGGEGSHAARAVRVTSRWGRNDTVIISESDRRIKVEGGIETDAHFAVIMEDANGLLQASMVGGTYLRRGGLRLATSRAAYEGTVTSFSPRTNEIGTSLPLPEKHLDGALVSFGNLPHRTAEYVRVKGESTRLIRSNEIFRSPVTRVTQADEAAGAVYPAIALPHTAAEPGFYIGATATDDSGSAFWKVKRTDVVEMWMPIFTPVADADITDADGDGKRTIRLTNFAPPETARDPVVLYHGPFVKPVRMKQHNRAPFVEPVVLEVTRVDEKGRRIFFKPPLHDYDLIWVNCFYRGTIVTNESGTRQWYGNVPAREFRIVLSGQTPVPADAFSPARAEMGHRTVDGRIHIHDFGPGDPYRFETHLSVQRDREGEYQTEGAAPDVSVEGVGR